MTPVRGKNEPLSWWMSYRLTSPWRVGTSAGAFRDPEDSLIVLNDLDGVEAAWDSIDTSIASLLEDP